MGLNLIAESLVGKVTERVKAVTGSNQKAGSIGIQKGSQERLLRAL